MPAGPDGRQMASLFTSSPAGMASVASGRNAWTQRRSGPPFAVYHSIPRDAPCSMSPVIPWLSVTHDRIAFTVGETTAYIWMATLEGQR